MFLDLKSLELEPKDKEIIGTVNMFDVEKRDH
jgi:hypothetical protein